MRPLRILFIGQLDTDQVALLKIDKLKPCDVIEKRLGGARVNLPPQHRGRLVEVIGDLLEEQKSGVRGRIGVLKRLRKYNRSAFERGNGAALRLLLVRQADGTARAEAERLL